MLTTSDLSARCHVISVRLRQLSINNFLRESQCKGERKCETFCSLSVACNFCNQWMAASLYTLSFRMQLTLFIVRYFTNPSLTEKLRQLTSLPMTGTTSNIQRPHWRIQPVRMVLYRDLSFHLNHQVKCYGDMRNKTVMDLVGVG